MTPDTLDKMSRANRAAPEMRDEFVTLSHGSGGKASQSLIASVFLNAFGNPILNRLDDHAMLNVSGTRLAFTTDSYVVDPIFFPGGDIGRLAINGTVNDLCTSGAKPLFISLGVILEEGFPIADLRTIAQSIAEAAREANVQIVTGDTKVVHRGKADKLFVNTAGIGVVTGPASPSISSAKPGDVVLLSGSIGDHGVTILAARGDLELELDTRSDTAPLHGLVSAIIEAAPDLHCLKDPTRGGVATSLNEIATQSGVGIEIREQALAVSDSVRGACEILGIDPLYMANEGKLIVVVPPGSADAALAAMRSHPLGRESGIVGRVTDNPRGMVLLQTAIGGRRVVDMLAGDALPRIC